MKCRKNCKCTVCELLADTEVVCIDDSNPFMETRHILKGYRCLGHGGVAPNVTMLKSKPFSDDFLYGEEAKEYIRKA